MVPSSPSPQEIESRLPIIADLIREVSDKAKNRIIQAETLLLEELALDSLDMVRVIMLIEDRHGVSIDLDEVAEMTCAGDVARALARHAHVAAA